MSKGVHKQELCNLEKLLQLPRIVYCFQIKRPKRKYWFLNTLRPKWCVLAESKVTHFVCVCSAHQNVVLLVDAMDLELIYKDLIKRIICNPESNKCMMHRYESCSGTENLKEFLDQELNEHEDDENFNNCQWDTTDRATLATITVSYEEYRETLIDVIDDLTRHSYITKLKITSS